MQPLWSRQLRLKHNHFSSAAAPVAVVVAVALVAAVVDGAVVEVRVVATLVATMQMPCSEAQEEIPKPGILVLF